MTVAELHERLETALQRLNPAVDAGDLLLSAAHSLLTQRLRQVERANDALTDAVLDATATLAMTDAILEARRAAELPL